MALGSTSLTNAVAYVSLFVSGTLAIFYIRDRRHAKYNVERDYLNQLLIWHASVVDVLIELHSILKLNSNEPNRIKLARLSSLIEQGRFYFPNIIPDDFGTDQPPAYRGYRIVALDFLVAPYIETI